MKLAKKIISLSTQSLLIFSLLASSVSFFAVESVQAKDMARSIYTQSTLGGQVLGDFDTNTKSPVGFVDGVIDGVADGWTFDGDYSEQSNSVHFYIDGQAGTVPLAGATTANSPRSDINNFFGISGNHGFRFQIPTQYRDGRQHTLYAYALDLTYGPAGTPLSHSTLGVTAIPFTWGTAATVAPGNTVPPGTGGIKPPQGTIIPGPEPIDTPSGGANPSTYNQSPIGYVNPVTSGGIVHGWAVDPDLPSRSLKLDIYIDGKSSSNFVASVQASIQDDNLNYYLNNTTLSGITGNHAFRYQLPSKWRDGRAHTVYVIAQDANTYSTLGNTRILPEALTEREGVVFTWSDRAESDEVTIFTPRSGETLKIKSAYNIGVSDRSKIGGYYLKDSTGTILGTLDEPTSLYATDRACLNVTTDSVIGIQCGNEDMVWNVGGYHPIKNFGRSTQTIGSDTKYAPAGCGYTISVGTGNTTASSNGILANTAAFCLSDSISAVPVPDTFLFTSPSAGEVLTEGANFTVRFSRIANNSGKTYALYLENNTCPQSTQAGLNTACTAIYRAPTELGTINSNQSSFTFKVPSRSLTSTQYLMTNVYVKEKNSDTIVARSENFKIVSAEGTGISVDNPQACIPISHTMVIGSTDADTEGDVSRVQNFLYRTRLLSVAPTGYYGPLTSAAVAEFQRQHNITVGGLVGPLTMAALNLELCSTITTIPPVSGGTDKYNSPLVVGTNDNIVVMQFEAWFGPQAVSFEIDPSNVQGVPTVIPWYNSNNMSIGYDSADPNIIEQQIELIEAAGVNAIAIDLSNGIACTFGDGTKYCGSQQSKDSFNAIKNNVAAVFKKVHEMSLAKETAIKIIPLIGAQRDLVTDDDFAPQADGKAPVQKATDWFLNLYAQYPELAVVYEGKPLFMYYHGAAQGEPGTNAPWERTNNLLASYQNKITKRNVGGFFDHQANQRVSTNEVSAIKNGRSFWTWIDRYNQNAGYYPSYQPNSSGGVEAFTAAFASPGRCAQNGFEGLCWGSRALFFTLGYPDDVTLANNGEAFRSYMDIAEDLKPTFLLIHQWNQYGSGDMGFDANTRTDIEPNDLIQYGNYNVLKSELAHYRQVVGN